MFLIALVAALGAAFAAVAAGRVALEPVAYTVRVPAPETRSALVEAHFPTGGSPSVDLMMPVWSPGFYRVESYAARVKDLQAARLDGRPLVVTAGLGDRGNRWRVDTAGAPSIVVRYTLVADQRSVTTNSVSPELGVLNAAAAFVTLAESGVARPHEVAIEPPPGWKRIATALDPVPGARNRWRASSYEELVDSPFVAGDLAVHPFTIDGRGFALIDAMAPPAWDGARAARDLAKVVAATRDAFGDLPFPRYLFLNVFRAGGGGLEHRNSTLLTASPEMAGDAARYRRWLAFVAHEFVHAYNAKRLRPAELGPFDFEREPKTGDLWIAEGLTTYAAELALVRAGLVTTDEFLKRLSDQIANLQGQPGRLLQTLEQSSLDVWSNSMSGVNAAPATVSYYVKGTVLGFVLDAVVRASSGGRGTLDDVLYRAYRRYGGERGFRPDEFRSIASDVAERDLAAWFRVSVASTDEVDYGPALAWFGLKFASSTEGDPARWTLRIAEDATPDQTERLKAWVSTPSATPRADTAIRETRARYNDAIARRDAASIGRFLLPSYLVVTGASAQRLGRDASVLTWTERFRDDPSVTFVRTPREIRINHAWGLAEELGDWRGRQTTGGGGLAEPSGSYSAKWQRAPDGAWLLQAEVFTTLACRGSALSCGGPPPVTPAR